MLTLYRGMKPAADGLPECGSTGRTLGVRVPDDIAPDPEGRVHPRTGGMSCAPDDPKLLVPHRRPPALGGTGRDPVFAFAVGGLTASLAARRQTTSHATVEPGGSTALQAYVDALHSTRAHWSKQA